MIRTVLWDREFSPMNSIKNKMRNRLDVAHREDILMIKLHLPENGDIDKVYNHWEAEKGRKDYLSN